MHRFPISRFCVPPKVTRMTDIDNATSTYCDRIQKSENCIVAALLRSFTSELFMREKGDPRYFQTIYSKDFEAWKPRLKLSRATFRFFHTLSQFHTVIPLL